MVLTAAPAQQFAERNGPPPWPRRTRSGRGAARGGSRPCPQTGTRLFQTCPYKQFVFSGCDYVQTANQPVLKTGPYCFLNYNLHLF